MLLVTLAGLFLDYREVMAALEWIRVLEGQVMQVMKDAHDE